MLLLTLITGRAQKHNHIVCNLTDGHKLSVLLLLLTVFTKKQCWQAQLAFNSGLDESQGLNFMI